MAATKSKKTNPKPTGKVLPDRRKYQPRPGSHLVLVLPDLHLPYQDQAALDCVMTAHAALKPKKTVILGDWLDCQAFSQHPVKSFAEERAHGFFESEIKPCRELLDELEKNTDEIVFIEGNHEFRLERTILQLGGDMADLFELVSPKRLLSEGRQKPFKFIPYSPRGETLDQSTYKIADDLRALHGWTHSVHASAQHLAKAKTCSVIHGHTHRRQSYETRDPFTNRVLMGFCPGTLSRLQPIYQTNNPTEWTHGFSLIWVSDELDRWTAYSPRIDDGVCVLPDGRKVDGKRSTVL